MRCIPPSWRLIRRGVVWLFFADATRKYTFFTRWLGSGWSDVYDGRGIHHAAPHFESHYLSPDEMCLEKQPPARATELGLFLAYPLLADQKEFHRIPLATPTLAAGTAVLFLDLLEVARMGGVELTLNEARRHPKNPVFTPGGPDSFDSQRVFNHGTVLLNKGVFRMWYSGLRREKGKPWWQWDHAGHAESKDGLEWSRVKVPQSRPGAT
jgi:hypothetical protein